MQNEFTSEFLTEILAQFPLTGTVQQIEKFGNGHINSTFQVTCVDGEKHRRYILQKINVNVFRDPDGLMDNIFRVTEFLRKKAAARGGDPSRETLTFLRTVDGQPYYHNNGGYWRVYRMVEGAHSHESATPELFYQAARSFGRFQQLLADFPAETLSETIPFFHHTAHRFQDLEEAIAKNAAGRLDSVRPEVEFLMARKDDCSVVLNAMAEGKIPVRVTHNDTKLNNILIDDQTGEGICIIDLDTIMPGSSLYDFGDSIRFGASSAAEDEKDLDKVFCRLDLFEAYVRGFVSEMGDALTDGEKEFMAFSAKLITMEIGIRFLTDYLNGDVYFATHYPDQNLDRARTQLKLVADMETKMDEMNEIVKRYC